MKNIILSLAFLLCICSILNAQQHSSLNSFKIDYEQISINKYNIIVSAGFGGGAGGPPYCPELLGYSALVSNDTLLINVFYDERPARATMGCFRKDTLTEERDFSAIGYIYVSANSLYLIEYPVWDTSWNVSDTTINLNATSTNPINVLENAIDIYPNPARESVFLNYDNVEINRILLTDISGRTIKQYNSRFEVLDIKGINAGMYWLHIDTKEGMVRKQIVVR